MGNVTHGPYIILCRLRDLLFVLVEVKRGVELRLAYEQGLHTRFVIKGLVGFALVANSLCRGQEKHGMRESEAQIGNPG